MRHSSIDRSLSRCFKRDVAELPNVALFLGGFIKDNAIGVGTGFAIDLAVEEVFTNMIKHNPGGSSDIEIALQADSKSVRAILVEKESPPFDLTQQPAADIARPLEERAPGGLGIHLVSRMMDEVKYEHHDSTSTITLVKRIESSHA